MQIGVYNLAIDERDVAIIFIDIYNFDEIIAEETTNIIRILDKLYRVFD